LSRRDQCSLRLAHFLRGRLTVGTESRKVNLDRLDGAPHLRRPESHGRIPNAVEV